MNILLAPNFDGLNSLSGDNGFKLEKKFNRLPDDPSSFKISQSIDFCLDACRQLFFFDHNRRYYPRTVLRDSERHNACKCTNVNTILE
jgi:hypothetical protein